MSDSAVATATTYNIDKVHSQVGFQVKHMGVATFRGQFNEFEGQVKLEDGELNAVEGTIDIASIDVRDSALSGHLATADFFDAENYPKGTLRSTAVTKLGEDKYRIAADLTLRGVTKPIEIEVNTEGPHAGMAGPTIGIEGETNINRFDYGIAWDAKLDNGALVVGESVKLVFHIEAVAAQEDGGEA
jgi:polyisoprenoid-binding protein YceI